MVYKFVGCNSSQRRKLLLEAFKRAGIPPKQPILRAATRWNSTEMMLHRILYILPALKFIRDEDMPTTYDDQESWSSLVRDVDLYKNHIDAILPVLNTVSQWTQALSTNGHVTISLVPLAVQKIHEQIIIMKGHAIDFRNTADRDILSDLASSLDHQLNIYFSEEDLQFYCYSVSTFLDPRVFPTLNKVEMEKAINMIKTTLVAEVDDEYRAPTTQLSQVTSDLVSLRDKLLGKRVHEEVNVPVSISGGGGSGGSGGRRGRSSFSSSSSSSSASTSSSSSLSSSSSFSSSLDSGTTPVDEEIAAYIDYMLMNPTVTDPLLVWPWLVKHSGLRILPLVVRRLFAIPACSSDVERLFSKAGYFVNPRRNQLGSETLNKLLVMNAYYTYRDTFLPRDTRNVQRTEKLKKFVGISCNSSSLQCDRYFDNIDSFDDNDDDEVLEMSDSESE